MREYLDEMWDAALSAFARAVEEQRDEDNIGEEE
jgi:hypothetical protein